MLPCGLVLKNWISFCSLLRFSYLFSLSMCYSAFAYFIILSEKFFCLQMLNNFMCICTMKRGCLSVLATRDPQRHDVQIRQVAVLQHLHRTGCKEHQACLVPGRQKKNICCYLFRFLNLFSIILQIFLLDSDFYIFGDVFPFSLNVIVTCLSYKEKCISLSPL